MKGFPPGPAPMNQLETAPLGGEAASPPSDPFAGMNLTTPTAPEPASGQTAAAVAGEEEAAVAEEEDFAGRAVAPEPEAEAAVQRPPADTHRGQPKAAPPPEKRRAAPKRPPVTDMHQLELRAIFGVDHELSHQEIIRRARALPGIRNLTTVDSTELETIEGLREAIARWGFGDGESIAISCGDGVIDFITAGETSLVVLYDGEYAPGVRETLIIVARELDKL